MPQGQLGGAGPRRTRALRTYGTTLAQVASPAVAFSPARGLSLARLSPLRLTAGLPRMTATLDEKSSAVEASLERLSQSSSMDPTLMAVVGLQEGVATYDRDATVAHFAKRPAAMAGRAFDFLQAYRRVKSAWDQGDGAGADRGAVLRAELSALGPVSVKIGNPNLIPNPHPYPHPHPHPNPDP